jgi:hypothetical protein
LREKQLLDKKPIFLDSISATNVHRGSGEHKSISILHNSATQNQCLQLWSKTLTLYNGGGEMPPKLDVLSQKPRKEEVNDWAGCLTARAALTRPARLISAKYIILLN